MERGIAWDSRIPALHPLTGFAHGNAGIAWALGELADLTGEARFRTAERAAVAYERSLFSAEAKNWPDLRDRDALGLTRGRTPIRRASWPHGATAPPGSGSPAFFRCGRLDESATRAEIEAALETTLAQGFGDNHSLCHGDLGNLETLLQAGERLADPRWRAEADRMAAVTLESIRRNGWICGVPSGVETPGLMTGLAGIGFGLLRLAEPRRTPSVLASSPRVRLCQLRRTRSGRRSTSPSATPGILLGVRTGPRTPQGEPVGRGPVAAGGSGPGLPDATRRDRGRTWCRESSRHMREPRHVPPLCLRPTERSERLRGRGPGDDRPAPPPAHRPGADARPGRHRPRRHQPARACSRPPRRSASRPRASRGRTRPCPRCPCPPSPTCKTEEGLGHFVVLHRVRKDCGRRGRPGARGPDAVPRRVLPALDRLPAAGGARARSGPAGAGRRAGRPLAAVPGPARPHTPRPGRGLRLRPADDACWGSPPPTSSSTWSTPCSSATRARLLNALGVGMVLIVLFRTLFGLLRQYLLAHVGRKVDLALIAGYARHLLRLPLRFFEMRQVGEILSRVNDAAKVREAISGTTLTAVVDGTLVVLMLGGALALRRPLALVATAFVPLLVAERGGPPPGRAAALPRGDGERRPALRPPGRGRLRRRDGQGLRGRAGPRRGGRGAAGRAGPGALLPAEARHQHEHPGDAA